MIFIAKDVFVQKCLKHIQATRRQPINNPSIQPFPAQACHNSPS